MKIGIDIGGTFTDAAFADPSDGTLRILKVPTTRSALEKAVDEAFEQGGADPKGSERFVHGTTIVTNRLIERTGGKVALLTTSGFEDVLEFQSGDRPNTYDVLWEKPEPFVPRPLRFGVRERIDASGRILQPLAESEIERVLDWVRLSSCDAVAVCLLNAHTNESHEQMLLAALQRSVPRLHCCISHDVDPAVREYERASTTVLNAYAMPTISEYVRQREKEWGTVQYMSSSGGAVNARTAATLPISLAYSGPAGGVVGAAALSAAADYGDLITFDMGGTSTDVAIVRNGRGEMRRSTDVDWGIPYRFPSLDIRSVGAGGGSILWMDSGGALRVGPRSAGVDPGPACYGRGGQEATITDVNVLGGLLPELSLGYGSISLDHEAAEAAVSRIAAGLGSTRADILSGGWRIVNANMAHAIRHITVYKGIDPRSHTLFCFGSAAGQHAAHVARELHIRRIVIPAAASVFAALGALASRLEVYGSCPLECTLDTLFRSQELLGRIRGIAHDVHASHDSETVTHQFWTLECRHHRQTHSIDVPFDPESDTEDSVQNAFLREHSRLYGVAGDGLIEVVNARLRLASSDPRCEEWVPERSPYDASSGVDSVEVSLEGESVPVVSRRELTTEDRGRGPLLVRDASSVVYVPSGFSWAVDHFRSIVMEST